MIGKFECDFGIVEISATYEPASRDLPAGYCDVCVESLSGVPFADLDEETQDAVLEECEHALWADTIEFEDAEFEDDDF